MFNLIKALIFSLNIFYFLGEFAQKWYSHLEARRMITGQMTISFNLTT